MYGLWLVLIAILSVQLPRAAEQEAEMMLTLQSPAFTAGQAIPKKYTCEGGDTSPPLAWTNIPAGARSLALIVDDPDAPDPDAPRMTWVHWVLYNIPPDAAGLAEGASSSALPPGAVEGPNDFGRVRYGGPCPPIGTHRYFHKLYALDIVLAAGKPLDKRGLEAAMRGHVLGEVQLMGTYRKAAK
jgi:Raf kinase inhibitor-like YbhB/YbcL family protein